MGLCRNINASAWSPSPLLTPVPNNEQSRAGSGVSLRKSAGRPDPWVGSGNLTLKRVPPFPVKGFTVKKFYFIFILWGYPRKCHGHLKQTVQPERSNRWPLFLMSLQAALHPEVKGGGHCLPSFDA